MKRDFFYRLLQLLFPIFLILIVTVPAILESENAADINDSISSATSTAVIVNSGNLTGSGNIWEMDSAHIIVVTASHVIADSSDIMITFSDDKTRIASLVSNDEVNDIAFLQVNKVYGDKYTKVNRAKLLKPADSQVFIVDPHTKTASAGIIAETEIYIEDFDQEMILCLLSADAGMSGSGLFDEQGHYLGMLLGGTDNSLAACLPVSRIDVLEKSR